MNFMHIHVYIKTLCIHVHILTAINGPAVLPSIHGVNVPQTTFGHFINIARCGVFFLFFFNFSVTNVLLLR